jgi:glycosyltransferase involved in cell wall biosynthesis
MRPRVVFVGHVARLSGGEIALLRLLPALTPYVDAHVVLGEDGPLRGRLEQLGVETEVLPIAPRLRDVRRATVRPRGIDMRALVPLPAYTVRLARCLRALRAEVVHTNTLKAALYGGTAGRLARVPVVWHIRDRIAPDYLPKSAVRLVRAAALVLPTAIVANSQSTLETLPEVARSGVLYNPVVPDAVTPRLSPRSGDGRQLTIGIVGRLAPWKGQHVFLDAFAGAFRGTDVRARVVGSPLFGENAYARSLERQAEQLGIRGQVEFRGFREDVWGELAELDVLVHASVSPEPFGQVVLEGMAAGLPVVAAGAGGPTELVTDGTDGLLTPPGDVAALADALRRLRDDRGLRDRLGAAASRRSREFTPERTARRLLEVYREILGPERVPLSQPDGT